MIRKLVIASVFAVLAATALPVGEAIVPPITSKKYVAGVDGLVAGCGGTNVEPGVGGNCFEFVKGGRIARVAVQDFSTLPVRAGFLVTDVHGNRLQTGDLCGGNDVSLHPNAFTLWIFVDTLLPTWDTSCASITNTATAGTITLTYV